MLDGDASCEDPGSYETNKKGRLKNTLLAQGITLTLNTRLSPELLVFPVDGTEFVTLAAADCLDPDAGGIPGTEQSYAFSSGIADALGEGATIADLLDLVNEALGGGDVGSLTLSQISDAATLVNEAFDECVVVISSRDMNPIEGVSGQVGGSPEEEEEEDEKLGGTKGLTGISGDQENVLGIFPNPVTDWFYLHIPSEVGSVNHAAVYSLTGVKVMSLDHPIEGDSDQQIHMDVSHLIRGIYVVRIESAAGLFTSRFSIQ